MAPSDSELVQTLDALIPAYLRALRTALAETVGSDRLSMQQLRTLQAVANADVPNLMTTTRLAALMSVSVPTMSSMLDGMAGRGFVERQPVPDNRRVVSIVITHRGRELLARYQSIMDARHLEIIAGLDAGEREVVMASATILLDALRRLQEIDAPGGAVGTTTKAGE